MKKALKSLVTALIVPACNRLPFLRCWLRPIGLRTEQRAYLGRKLRVPLQGRGVVTLTHADKNYMTFELFWRGPFYYEPLTVAVLRKLFEGSHDAFIDAGANVGYFSLIHGASCPGLETIAFEPSLRLLPILKENVAENSVSGATFTVEAKALSDQVGTQHWFQSESDMSGSLVAGFRENIREEYEVETTSLDAYLENRQDIRSLITKIDVESNEPNVLRGLLGVMETRECEIIIEGLEALDAGLCEVIHDLGYRIYSIQKGGLVASSNLGIVSVGNAHFWNYYITRSQVDEVDQAIKVLSQRLDFRTTSNHAEPPAGAD